MRIKSKLRCKIFGHKWVVSFPEHCTHSVKKSSDIIESSTAYTGRVFLVCERCTLQNCSMINSKGLERGERVMIDTELQTLTVSTLCNGKSFTVVFNSEIVPVEVYKYSDKEDRLYRGYLIMQKGSPRIIETCTRRNAVTWRELRLSLAPDSECTVNSKEKGDC